MSVTLGKSWYGTHVMVFRSLSVVNDGRNRLLTEQEPCFCYVLASTVKVIRSSRTCKGPLDQSAVVANEAQPAEERSNWDDSFLGPLHSLPTVETSMLDPSSRQTLNLSHKILLATSLVPL